jgi:hypothetical protein
MGYLIQTFFKSATFPLKTFTSTSSLIP